MGRKQKKERRASRQGGTPGPLRALGIDIGRVIAVRDWGEVAADLLPRVEQPGPGSTSGGSAQDG